MRFRLCLIVMKVAELAVLGARFLFRKEKDIDDLQEFESLVTSAGVKTSSNYYREP